MDKSCNDIRYFMIEPIMKKLYDVEKRLTQLEDKIEKNISIRKQEPKVEPEQKK